MGYRQAPGRDSSGRADVQRGRQYQRAPGGDRRDHVRRPQGTRVASRRGHGLRQSDLLRLTTFADRAPGDQDHGRTGRGAWLLQQWRIVFDFRLARSLDHGDDRQRGRGQRRRVGGHANSGRLRRRTCESGSHSHVPSSRWSCLDHVPATGSDRATLGRSGLRPRRNQLRAGQAVVHRRGQGLQFLGHLRAGRFRIGAILRSASVGHLPPVE